jgi:hypothetical protein
MEKIWQKNYFLDSALTDKEADKFISFSEAKERVLNFRQGALKSTLFSRYGRKGSFFTNDSGLYISPYEYELAGGKELKKASKRSFDSARSKIVTGYRIYRPSQSDFLYRKFLQKYEETRRTIDWQSAQFFRHIFSPERLWNFTIVGAILFGMVSMTFIYRYLGQGALAGNTRKIVITNEKIAERQNSNWTSPLVLGAETFTRNENREENELDDETGYIFQVMEGLEKAKKEEFESEVRKIVKGYPVEKMLPYIMEKDRIVVAFLIGIAKKESNWGIHVPLLNGQDCYNYWGYRGIRKLMGTAGHTCFNSRKDAVDTVAKRLGYLIEKNGLNTPGKMVIWKCGSACSHDDQQAVQKWISDVNLYFQKLND